MNKASASLPVEIMAEREKLYLKIALMKAAEFIAETTQESPSTLLLDSRDTNDDDSLQVRWYDWAIRSIEKNEM